MNRLGWKHIGLALGGIAALSDSAYGCLFCTVTGIGHSGGLTDYGTATDEITIDIGVGTMLSYKYENVFSEGKQVTVPHKKIQFPCFHEEAMWIQVTETDDYENEQAQITILCNTLQLGKNSIAVELIENSAALETVADAFKDIFGTSWSFFDEAVGENDPAIYTITLEVTEICINEPLTSRFEHIDGTLEVYENDPE